MKKAARPPLTFAQYSRIHNVVASLARHFGRAEGTHCILYGICGAAIMREHYGMEAKVFCGAGGVVIHAQGDAPVITAWGSPKPDGRVVATPEAFHCWVECDDWVIDFSAPGYQRGFESSSRARDVALPRIPKRMLQKPVSQVGGGFGELSHVGQAAFHADPALTAELVGQFLALPGAAELVRAACAWHGPAAHLVLASISVTDDRGTATTIPLVEQELAGAW